jgi:ketosteroid isomerase-like protein
VAFDALDPVHVVEHWQARAWGDFDLTAVDELVADPLRRHGPSGTVERSHEELKDDLRQYRRTLCKPTITVNDRVVQGDCVWSRVTMHGHNIESGEPHAVEWLQVHRVVDGRIVELWSLYASGVTW